MRNGSLAQQRPRKGERSNTQTGVLRWSVLVRDGKQTKTRRLVLLKQRPNNIMSSKGINNKQRCLALRLALAFPALTTARASRRLMERCTLHPSPRMSLLTLTFFPTRRYL